MTHAAAEIPFNADRPTAGHMQSCPALLSPSSSTPFARTLVRSTTGTQQLLQQLVTARDEPLLLDQRVHHLELRLHRPVKTIIQQGEGPGACGTPACLRDRRRICCPCMYLLTWNRQL